MNCVAEPTTPIMPKPMDMPTVPEAPLKPRAQSRVVYAVPFQLEEVDSVADLLTEDVETQNDWRDPDELLEYTHYDDKTNKLYKLYNDGTWDYIIVKPDLIN